MKNKIVEMVQEIGVSKNSYNSFSKIMSYLKTIPNIDFHWNWSDDTLTVFNPNTKEVIVKFASVRDFKGNKQIYID